jgi:hypothetical protein
MIKITFIDIYEFDISMFMKLTEISELTHLKPAICFNFICLFLIFLVEIQK